MKQDLLKISLRQNAIYVPNEAIVKENELLTGATFTFVENVAKNGFSFSEPLLKALNNASYRYKIEILKTLDSVLGSTNNWTPLVRNWSIPTGETRFDHLVTWLANIKVLRNDPVKTLQCGHIIPENTFPLERYNGCPFCGKPFVFGNIERYGQTSKLKVLELWTDEDLTQYFLSLLQAKTALDATQIDSLKMLLKYLPLPKTTISMKETLVVVIDTLIEQNQSDKAQLYLSSPTDILRYLWYKKTGFLQIIEPKNFVKKVVPPSNKFIFLNGGGTTILEAKLQIKLKYTRAECLMVATWLNNLELDIEKICEMMHPKRGMWVRFIRALRLPEYSKKKGFEKLAELLDVFYNQLYNVWQGNVNNYRLKCDTEKTFGLLKQRPGLFARSLFANMLWFGPEQAVAEFSQVIDKVPARLVFTLNMYAKNYFETNIQRSVRPLGGINKRIAPNPLLKIYSKTQLESMQNNIEELCLLAVKKRFTAVLNNNKTIFIDEQLFNMPVAIGDRSQTIQDLPVALMGTRFPVEGNSIRLFMQWGKDMPAQHLDMDLSCNIAYASKTEYCSYSNLVATGCMHSGDIQSIPDQIGAAEYIEIDLDALSKAKAKYVSFTCNAYTYGNISPNLVVGWMDSKYPMHISETTGVAYDPSCVQHQVRVTQNLAKGLVFGVLDVENREIMWLEMTFSGEVVQGLDYKGVQALINKLSSKLNIGDLLLLKAEAQKLERVDTPDADEVYDKKWAIDSAKVTQLLVD
ncbi:hypothetical protein [Emticicia sp. C21]|uniref:hypothetical protein n=1 Tax=Emticicia sp. C21 TaxID=2302915 RepID=UPI000E3523A1|nr:hypothetical protein [Emticicia sp. C21]RFS14651.1 hypothetical protein D0T08_20685 [Emticicia sp. C21]